MTTTPLAPAPRTDKIWTDTLHSVVIEHLAGPHADLWPQMARHMRDHATKLEAENSILASDNEMLRHRNLVFQQELTASRTQHGVSDFRAY